MMCYKSVINNPTYTRMEYLFHSNFIYTLSPPAATRKIIGGDDPFNLKFWAQLTQLLQKRRFSFYIRS